MEEGREKNRGVGVAGGAINRWERCGEAFEGNSNLGGTAGAVCVCVGSNQEAAPTQQHNV